MLSFHRTENFKTSKLYCPVPTMHGIELSLIQFKILDELNLNLDLCVLRTHFVESSLKFSLIQVYSVLYKISVKAS